MVLDIQSDKVVTRTSMNACTDRKNICLSFGISYFWRHLVIHCVGVEIENQRTWRRYLQELSDFDSIMWQVSRRSWEAILAAEAKQ